MPRAQAVLSLLLLALLGAACSSGVEEELALARIDQGCQLNSDCEGSLVCVFGRCHDACVSSRDCKHGARCVRGRDGTNVCQLSREQSCRGPADCAGTQLCAIDGACRDACAEASQCPAEQACTGGTCADATELNDRRVLPRPPSDVPRRDCDLDSDCTPPLVCIAGGCHAECDDSRPCATGSMCRDGVCEGSSEPGCVRNSDCLDTQICNAGTCEDAPPEPACRYDSDCLVPGQHCRAGICDCECLVDPDCGEDQSCQSSCDCAPSTVVTGSVRITNSEEARALASVTKIAGTLLIYPGDTPLLVALPHLAEVGALSVVGTNTVFVAEQLTTSFDYIECLADCRLPKLKSAGAIRIAPLNPLRKLELDFPSLETALDLAVENGTPGSPYYRSPQLKRLSLPRLRTLRSLRLYGNQDLARLDLGKLEEVEDVTVNENTRMTELLLPFAHATGAVEINQNGALQRVRLGARIPKTVHVTQNPQLTSLTLPRLQQTMALSSDLSSIFVSNNPGLSTLDLRRLEATDRLTIQEGGAPELLDLRSLKTVTSAFVLHGLSGIGSIYAPHFTTAGTVHIGMTSLKTLDLPLGKPADPKPGLPDPVSPELTSLEVSGNFELTDVILNELQAVTASIQLNGNAKLKRFSASRLVKAGALSSQSSAQLPACDLWAVAGQITPPIVPFFNGVSCPCKQEECP